MNYDASHESNPGPGTAARLVNYATQNGTATVVDPRGMPVGETDVDRFRATVTEADSSALHSFAFADEHDPDDLVAAVREPLSEHLDGTYLIGVHEDTDKPHLHVAECGSREDLYLPASKIAQFAPAVAAAVGETIEVHQDD